ncbi:MAG: glycosyltransferase [Deltaproteobacteria bacterium]|jgi:glycosyltransferase involved in cell wall biosynthesis|nr:glycosyltransferase [Deltaproteobacteria bacterium]
MARSPGQKDGLISVIAPVYNSSRFLPSFVEGMDRQSDRNFELIMVDDCSTDDSLAMMESLAVGRGNIRLIRREANGGPGLARNTGIEAAAGDFIMFVDVDDSFSDGYLGTMRAVIEKDNADMAFCGSADRTVWREIHDGVFYNAERHFYKLYSGRDALHNFFGIFRNEINFKGTPWAKIIRMSFYDRTGLRFPPCFFEDIILTFKELALAGSVACYNGDMYFWNRRNFSSGSRKFRDRTISDLAEVPGLVYDFVESNDLMGEIGDEAARFCLFIFRYSYQSYYSDRFYLENFDRIVSSFHSRLSRLSLENDAYYVFFQLFLLYLTAVGGGRADHFVKFMAPFRQLIEGQLEKPCCAPFNEGQYVFMRRLLETRDCVHAASPARLALGRVSRKLLRELYLLLGDLQSSSVRSAFEKFVIRLSGLFDSDYYISQGEAGSDGRSSALDRFVECGGRDGRNPNGWFDVESYFRAYPDVKESGRNPLVDFYLFESYKRRYF